MGHDAYMNIFAEVKRITTKEETKESKKWKVINGEYVGKKMAKPAKGNPEIDPAICPHHVANMKPRGNGRQMWWTCNACLTRWERIPIEIKESTDVTKDEDVLAFGKHSGKTYKEVLENDPSYARWVVSTQEQQESSHKGFSHFAAYILKKEYEEANGKMDDAGISDSDMLLVGEADDL